MSRPWGFGLNFRSLSQKLRLHMGRVIRTEATPAKRRHQYLRSCAEVLHLLAQRPSFDEEARDMVAFFVFNLRSIARTIDESAQVWEDRGYWRKAESLRAKWRWTCRAADELERLIRQHRWDAVPPVLLRLMPHFQHITVATITRNADWWCGALKALLRSSTRS